MDARAANDRVAEKARRLQFVNRVPMICECSSNDCHTMLMVTLEEYEEIRRDPEAFLVAHGHELEGSGPQSVTPTAEYVVRRRGNGDRRSA